MDEIRHILVERDILAGSRGGGGWLVQLLYAFQDEESIYLAMVFNFYYDSNCRNTSLVETSVR